jgi:hypothetical protein
MSKTPNEIALDRAQRALADAEAASLLEAQLIGLRAFNFERDPDRGVSMAASILVYVDRKGFAHPQPLLSGGNFRDPWDGVSHDAQKLAARYEARTRENAVAFVFDGKRLVWDATENAFKPARTLSSGVRTKFGA